MSGVDFILFIFCSVGRGETDEQTSDADSDSDFILRSEIAICGGGDI